MRPTGRLHLGHYFGALSNWLKLQKEYECFFFVADWHALTTHYEDTSSIAENTLQVAMDWLSAGARSGKIHVICAIECAGARRAARVALNDYAAFLARTRAYIQRAN